MSNKKTAKYSPVNAGSRRLTRGPGRPKGALNKVTVEVRAAAAVIVDDPLYRANLLRRARAGKLAPGMELALWYYAKGKPREEPHEAQELHVIWDDGSGDVSSEGHQGSNSQD